MTSLTLFIAILLSVTIGYIFGGLTKRKKIKPIGNLRIDQSDPEQPYMFLELDSSITDLNQIMNEKQITLEVVVKNYITQN